MGVVGNEVTVSLPADRAYALWTDTSRWPSFVEGFGRVESLDAEWPEPGSKVVWVSGPGGRGRVTEKVRERDGGRIVSTVFEAALSGTQTVTFEAATEEETKVAVLLDYELQKGGPLRGLTDVLFIRGALSAAQRRTLQRFATEAADEAPL
jgi:uncharacterized membrane protein